MVTITLDELQRNQVLAALDERSLRLGRELARLREQRDSPDNAFAVDTVKAAIGQTMNALLTIAEALPEPEYPADMTLGGLDERWHQYLDR